MNILDKIILDKREHVKHQKTIVPIDKLKASMHYHSPIYSLKERISRPNDPGIIAEFKRRSPSKGLINTSAVSPTEVGIAYEKAGAAAISVLTDTKYFGGTNDDLIELRKRVNIPILRKDFIIDTYQIHEAKSIGADVILLIGAVLTKVESQLLCDQAKALDLEVLYEIHDKSEIQNIPSNVDIVGINNRDLKAFKVDFNYSKQVYDLIPENVLKISESGISHPDTINELHKKGFNGFLIGENFMKTSDPGDACKKFITQCKNLLQ